MLTLRILIAGLIAIVPSPNNHSVSLLFVDGRAAFKQRFPKEMPSHSFHLPTLFTLAGHCSGEGCLRIGGIPLLDEEGVVETLAKRRLIAPKHPLIWIPSREYMQIDWQGKKGDFERLGPVTDYPLPTSTAETALAQWIPEIKDIAPSWRQIDHDCLRDANGCPVQAQIQIPGGILSTCRLATDNHGKVFAYRFRSGSDEPSEPRAVADLAMIEVQVPAGRILLKSMAQDRSRELEEVILEPDDVKGYKRIDLFLTNLPIGDEPIRSILNHTAPEIHGHGALIAQLSTLPQASKPFPVPEKYGDPLDNHIEFVADGCKDLLRGHKRELIFRLFFGILNYLINKPECGGRIFNAAYP